MTGLNNILPVVSFYDLHAAEYDSHMSASDNRVRLVVRQLLKYYVSDGKVLDFGGGTGLDLQWLSEHYAKAFFLEPSTNMRVEAHKVAFGFLNVSFVEKNIDFNNWDEDNLPFSEKVNGIIANFAVLNCIENIDTLFQKLALICTNNGYIVATVLNTSLKNLFKNYSLKIALKSVLNQKITIANNQTGISHVTYLHTPKQYIVAAKEYFDIIKYNSIVNSSFAVLILKKK